MEDQISGTLSIGATPPMEDASVNEFKMRACSSKRSNTMETDCRINSLTDELLIEVLHRLPSSKLVFQCKTVCKRWHSILSSAYFVRCIQSRQISMASALFLIYPAVLHGQLINGNGNNGLRVRFVRNGNDQLRVLMSDFESVRLNLESPEFSQKFNVLASSHGLILCRPTNAEEGTYFLCNPLSMDFFALPRIYSKLHLKHPSYNGGVLHYGLVAERNYDFVGEIPFNKTYRFRVVLIPLFFPECPINFIVEIYCSETNNWNEYEMPSTTVKYPFPSYPPTSWRGKMYWFIGNQKLVAFDPFNFENSHTIDYPPVHLPRSPEPPFAANWCHLGVCQGILRLLDMPSLEGPISGVKYILSVWELKDHSWSLKREVFLNELVSKDCRIQECIRENLYSMLAFAFHPTNEDILYLKSGDLVLSYNMRNRELEVVSETPHPNDALPCFHLELPWSTKPVTAILHNPFL